VLESIAICKKSINALLTRTLDVDHHVRITAFSTLAQKVPLKSLSIAQRVATVSNGLKDR
jgi:hypothetical protein